MPGLRDRERATGDAGMGVPDAHDLRGENRLISSNIGGSGASVEDASAGRDVRNIDFLHEGHVHPGLPYRRHQWLVRDPEDRA